MIPDVTLVTACYDLSRFHDKCRDADTQITNFAPLLEVPCYLVIFTDQKMFPLIQKIRSGYGMDKLTKYTVQEFENLWSARYVENVKTNRKEYHPTKDERTCAESHLLCCNKFDFVLQAIDDNYFGTKKFGWIDSNVGPNFSKLCIGYTNNMLINVLNRVGETFYTQLITKVNKKFINPENWREYYKEYRWVVVGSLFTTGAVIGRKILAQLKDVFTRHTLAGYGHAEEMLYLEVLETHANLFTTTFGDYKHTINNFVAITKGVEFIYYNFIRTAMEQRYFQEAIDCCTKVIRQLDNYNTEVNYDIYFKIYFELFIATYYVDRERSSAVVKTIFERMRANPLLFKEYQREKAFYDSQFKFSSAFTSVDFADKK
jgi:hypothetical protein